MKGVRPPSRAKVPHAAPSGSRGPRKSAAAHTLPDDAAQPRRAEPEPVLAARSIYGVAAAAAALWALGLVVATGPLPKSWHVLTLLALLMLGPAALLFGLAYLVRQCDRLAAASLGSDDQGMSLLGPALRAASEAGRAAGGVQGELAAAAAAAERARSDLETLRPTLASERGEGASGYCGEGASSLAGRLSSERSDLAALSHDLDAQLAEAAQVIELHLERVAGTAAAAAVKFDEADQAIAGRTLRLVPAVEQAAAAVRAAGVQAGRQADGVQAAAGEIAAQAAALAEALPEHRERLLFRAEQLRAERDWLLGAVRAKLGALQAFVGRIGAAATEAGAQILQVAGALRGPTERVAVPVQPADVEPAAPIAEAQPMAVAKVSRPARRKKAEAPAPVLTARGIGGQVIFDGARVLIDRTQSESFVIHGSGGQRTIQLREVVKIRIVPPRRGSYGYLQFVLGRGREGRGGPADVNSILFDTSQQASFQRMADVLTRAARHLRRRPEATDPYAPGEMAHLLELRGRGLIDSKEFAEASARLGPPKRRRTSWLKRGG